MMTNLLSIKQFTDNILLTTILTILSLFHWGCLPTMANVTGAPVLAANEDLLSEGIELSALVDPNSDMQSARKEYERLEQECANLGPCEIIRKANLCFVKQTNMEKGAMYMRIVTSRYADDLSTEEKHNCATAYANLGYYLIFERNNPIQAYPLLIKGLEICNSVKFDDIDGHYLKVNTITGINTNIAKIFSIFRDSRRALHYYRHAYQTARDDNNPIALPMTFTDLLHYAWTTDSLTSISAQIKEYDGMNIPNNAYRFMHDYGKMMANAAIEYMKQDYGEALAMADSAAKNFDPYVDDRRYIVHNRIIAGKIAMEQKDYAKASDCFKEAEGMIRSGKLEDLYDLMYRTQAEFHKATGNSDLAEKYRYEGLRVRDSLQQMQSYGVIRNMELSMQAKDYNERLSVSRKETQKWIYIAVGAGVLILIICVLTVRILIKNRRLKEQSESLFRKNLELMTLTAPNPQPNPAEDAEPEEAMPDHQKELTEADTSQGNEEDISEIYRQVLEYMGSQEEIFSPSFTVESLARSLGLKVKVVSQAINSIGGKNFNTLLAEFRIKKACERMLESPADPALRPTIEALAEEVGYKSRTSFMRVFKSVTGLTTTEFLRQATAK